MKVTHAGIAVALAVGLVAFFLILPSWNPFAGTPEGLGAVAVSDEDITSLPMQTTTELQMRDDVAGEGATAEPGDTITVNYVGALATGQVFDASARHGNEGFTFILGSGQVIKGWDEGVVGMKEGGRRTLVIPAELAYGQQGVGGVIPPGATLVFEIELVKVVKGR